MRVDVAVVLCSGSSMPYLVRCCRGGRRVERNFLRCRSVIVLAWWRVSGSTVCTVELLRTIWSVSNLSVNFIIQEYEIYKSPLLCGCWPNFTFQVTLLLMEKCNICPTVCVTIVVFCGIMIKQDRQCTYNIETWLRKNCCCGKALCTTYSGCVFVVLVNWHADCIHRIIRSSC